MRDYVLFLLSEFSKDFSAILPRQNRFVQEVDELVVRKVRKKEERSWLSVMVWGGGGRGWLGHDGLSNEALKGLRGLKQRLEEMVEREYSR